MLNYKFMSQTVTRNSIGHRLIFQYDVGITYLRT